MSVFMLIYYAGIASCGMQGAKKAMGSPNLATIFVISPLLASFGGGFIRDTPLLHVFPVVLTAECRPDIIIALIAASVYLSAQKNCHMRGVAEWFSVVADACALGTFIAIGVDKAIDIGANPIITLLCGVATSLGGGILSSVFCGVPILDVLSSSVSYRLTVVLGTAIYILGRYTGIENAVARYAIVFYTTVTILAGNQMVKQWIKKRIKAVSYGEFICCTMFIPCKAEAIKSPCMKVIFYLRNTYKATYRAHVEISRRTLLFHRILQM